MKLIDADAIEKAVRKRVYAIEVDDILAEIANASSIDIVRCKECKHNYNTAINHGKMQPRCDFADWKLTENDYCSRGERREP